MQEKAVSQLREKDKRKDKQVEKYPIHPHSHLLQAQYAFALLVSIKLAGCSSTENYPSPSSDCNQPLNHHPTAISPSRYFSTETYVVSTTNFIEMVLMRGQNIYFHWEIKKKLYWNYPPYSLLSGALTMYKPESGLSAHHHTSRAT